MTGAALSGRWSTGAAPALSAADDRRAARLVEADDRYARAPRAGGR